MIFMENNLVLKKILNKSWFGGVRDDSNLFFFDLRALGEAKYIPKEYCVMPKLLLPKDNKMIRCFSKEDAKKFHLTTYKRLKQNPKVFANLFESDFELWKNAKLLKVVDSKTFLKAVEIYQKHCANFMLGISFGMVCGDHKDLLNAKLVARLYKQHDKWRNTITFYEEQLLKKIEDYLIANDLKTFNTISFTEFKKFCKDKTALTDLIKKRHNKKLVYVFYGKHSSVITNLVVINAIVNHVFLQQISKSKEISGRVAFQTKEFVEGKAVLIPTQKELDKYTAKDLEGKIVVALQTTPHYTPYIHKVKGIITDEGGITSHAAIVSRELEIPCIVGTQNATKQIKTGDKIRMNLKTGKVIIL